MQDHLRGMLVVGAGVTALSFDALLVRLAGAAGMDVVFWRGSLMALALAVVLVAREGRVGLRLLAGGGLPGAVCALMLGCNGALFVLSVMHTRVANTVVILATTPLFAAVLSRVFLRERVAPRTWAAIAAGLAGVLLVFGGSLGAGGLGGDLLAAASALAMAGNLTVLRRHDIPRIPMVSQGGVVSALLALPLAAPFALEPASYAVLAVMGLVQMPLALVLVFAGTRYLPAPEVSLFLLLETVLAPVWVWFALGEPVPPATFAGGTLIVAALAANGWLGLRAARRLAAPGV